MEKGGITKGDDNKKKAKKKMGRATKDRSTLVDLLFDRRPSHGGKEKVRQELVRSEVEGKLPQPETSRTETAEFAWRKAYDEQMQRTQCCMEELNRKTEALKGLLDEVEKRREADKRREEEERQRDEVLRRNMVEVRRVLSQTTGALDDGDGGGEDEHDDGGEEDEHD